MKQKVLYLFLSLMLMSISVSAQTGGGRITGVVIDDSGEEPLPGTTIFIEELKRASRQMSMGISLFQIFPQAPIRLP